MKDLVLAVEKNIFLHIRNKNIVATNVMAKLLENLERTLLRLTVTDAVKNLSVEHLL